MAYTFDPVFAVDPNNPANVAKDASITIFDPADVTQAPITITDPTGVPLENPITVDAAGMGPAYQHPTLARVGWKGAGFVGYFTSYEGMFNETVAAKEAAQAAESAASTAGANAASAASAALAGAVADAEAAQAAAAASAALVAAPADTAIAAAINGAGTETATALSATILEHATPLIASEIANPETPANDAVSTMITTALAGFAPSSVPMQLFIGADLTTARPDWDGPVYWITTVVDGVPDNVAAGDQIIEVDAEPMPILPYFADDFNRADATTLGTTPTGVLTWNISGAGGSGVIVSNRGGVANTGTTRTIAYVSTPSANGVYTATLGVKDTGIESLVFRFQDSNNYLSLSRESSGLVNWTLWKRVAGTASIVQNSTTPITAADQIEVTLNGTSVIVKVNGVQIISATVADLAAATGFGFGSITTFAARWDNLELMPLEA